MGIFFSILIAPYTVPECIITGLGLGVPFGTVVQDCLLSLGSVDDELRRGLTADNSAASDVNVDWAIFHKYDDKKE